MEVKRHVLFVTDVEWGTRYVRLNGQNDKQKKDWRVVKVEDSAPFRDMWNGELCDKELVLALLEGVYENWCGGKMAFVLHPFNDHMQSEWLDRIDNRQRNIRIWTGQAGLDLFNNWIQNEYLRRTNLDTGQTLAPDR